MPIEKAACAMCGKTWKEVLKLVAKPTKAGTIFLCDVHHPIYEELERKNYEKANAGKQ